MKKVTLTLILIITGIMMFNFLSKQKNDMDISVTEFREKVENNPGRVIDVRTRAEYEDGHLKITDEQFDWLNGDFHDAVEGMDKSETYYLYCRSGNRSGQAARMMRDKGFKNVYNVGGFEELVQSGFEPEYE